MNYLIIGQGSIGQQVSNALAQRSTDNSVTAHLNQVSVTGLARKQRDAYNLSANVAFIQQDATTLTAEQLTDYTHICIIVAPNMGGMSGMRGIKQATPQSNTATCTANTVETAYKNTYLAIAEHLAKLQPHLTKLERIVFISSTGVYGQDNGEWIDETTVPALPQRVASQYILHAEQVLQSAFTDTLSIIRASGIYGKERLMRVRIAKDDNKKPMAPYAWTNRIMDSDLVTIIVKVMTITKPKPVYIATDYLPVTSFELTRHLAEQLGSTIPQIDESLPVSGKRLHSNIPRDWLVYADWYAGYDYILDYLSSSEE